MKIGIFTFHRAHNFGAVLQAFALKKTLEKLGHTVKFIDYWPLYRKGMYSPFNWKLLSLNPRGFTYRVKALAENIIILKERIRRARAFTRFIEDNLGVSGEASYSSADQIPDDCDLYIYGSDQIWRYNKFSAAEGFDVTYWGSFPTSNTNKIAYAASMGELALDNATNKCTVINLLSNFKKIGVRERTLREKLEEISDVKCSQVLDPVFLISPGEWRSYMQQVNHVKDKKYILFYNLLYSKKAEEYVRMLAEQRNCDTIIEINGGKKPLTFSQSYPGKLSYSPFEFLYLIDNADFVVSTSFHGTAFSLIFEKEVVALGMGKNSERAASLLQIAGIPDRLKIDESLALEEDIQTIDFQKVRSHLDLHIQESYDFLLQSIK